MLTTLELGAVGDDVKELKRLLNRKLVPSPHLKEEDPKFDPKTDAAVKKFQKHIGHTTDGVVGPMTWIRLYIQKIDKSPEPPSNPPSWMRSLYKIKSNFSSTPWMEIEKGEIGTARVKGPENNPRILEYFKSVGSNLPDEEAWCSAFANWVMKEAGYEGTNSAWALNWRDANWGGKRLEEPRYGAITVVHKKGPKEIRHVSFFVRQTNTHIYLLGGNQTFRKYDMDGNEREKYRVESIVTESKYPKNRGIEFTYFWPTEAAKKKVPTEKEINKKPNKSAKKKK